MKSPSAMPLSILASWEALVRAAPQARALIDAGRSWTRAELQERVLSQEAALIERLALPSQAKALAPRYTALQRRRVALALPNGVDWFACFLALLRQGAVPVLLDSGEHPERLRQMCGHLGVFLLREGGEWKLLAEPGGSLPRRRPSSEFLVKVTSGSTGLPKALAFDEEAVLADGVQVCSSMGIRAADTNVAVIPLGHSYGLGNLVLPLLLEGSPVHCVATPLPSCIAEELLRWRSTVFPAVPALLRALARSELPSSALDSLRLVITAGAPITPEEAAAFEARFGKALHVFYGSSETGGITYDRRGESAKTGRGVGTAMEGVRLRVLRGSRLEVRSAAVRGRGRRFLPSDRVELSAEGELRLLGRLGRMFKLAGRRLDLAGLEVELARLPGVQGVLVEPHASKPEALAALVATQLSLPELKALILTRFPAWKLPARLRIVDELPLTQRGKVDRARAALLLRD